MSVAAMSAQKADPVLMTVDGKDVHVSEFEYLYDKNNNQQLEPQTLDQYLDMFAVYKLKVADAEHAGIDRSESFIKEFDKFRKELSAPYLIDNDVKEQLIQESFGHRKNEVTVSHIMMQGKDAAHTLDSLRTAIVEGKTTFEDAARTYSIDTPSARRGGLMGFVTPGRFPWPFEKAAYETAVGQISPVVNSGMGFHLIRVESIKPSEGEVNAAHILLMTRGKKDDEIEAQHQLIDSIYNAVKAGADFAEMAKRYSQDPGSASKGGDLGWFGRGVMVAQFDSTAFALPDGGLSAPFRTSFGYHIIKRNGSRHNDVLDADTRRSIEASMTRDERGAMPQRAKLEQLKKQYNAQLNKDELVKLRLTINGSAGKYDSTMIARLAADNNAIATFDGGKITVAEAMENASKTPSTDIERTMQMLEHAATATLDNAILEAERARLLETNADYRNLVNEYRDGILLYEISNNNVWDKAAKDTEGLEAFFHKNIAKYQWDQPKFKSFIFFADNDSVVGEALEYAKTLDVAVPTEFTSAMRRKFGNKLKVERVIAAKGENAITDYLGFGAAKPDNGNKTRWTHYAAFNGRVILAPEESADVRGAAVTDYQAALEKEWVKQLRKQYKVKIDKKVFEQLKKSRK